MTVNKVDELKEATREANAMLKDLKRERQEVQKLVDSIPVLVKKLLDEGLGEIAKKELDALGDNIDLATAKIYQRFDTIEKLLLDGPGTNPTTLDDYATAIKVIGSIERKKRVNGE